jgi:predicted acyl esterase
LETRRRPARLVGYLFHRGHRIVVQIESGGFAIRDRNPTIFVPNIFQSRAGDYRKATQRVFRHAHDPGAIVLPTVAARAATSPVCSGPR